MEDNRIFIGKIPQSVAEQDIRSYFEQFGEIEHVQCPFSNKPFKIAFVTYTDAAGRDKAISFTGHNLQNSPLNVVKASPKPQKSFDSGSGFGFGQAGEARVFVGHIPESVTEEMLQTYFATFGTLLKCFKPAQGSRGGGRTADPPGYAFVTFSSPKEKHLCLAQESHEVNGNALRVMEAKPKPQTQGGFGGGGGYGGGGGGGYGGGYGGGGGSFGGGSYGGSGGGGGGFVAHGQDETNPKRIFLSHMQPAVNDATLRTHFAQFGTITDVFIPQPQPADSSPEDPKGFAYISFEDTQSVYRCLALKEHLLSGARIDVQEARPKSSRRLPPPVRGGRQDPRVFIGKIPKHVTDDIIATHFSQFGEVKEFYRPREQNNRDGLSFGFLTYTSIPDLARCLAVLSHQLSDGTVLSVTRARPRPAPSGGGGDRGGDRGASGGSGFNSGGSDMSYGQQMTPQMFGQQGYGASQRYNPYGQQQQQQQFSTQQFGTAGQGTQAYGQTSTQQFASPSQFGATPQYGMTQTGYGGQVQQAPGMVQGMSSQMAPGMTAGMASGMSSGMTQGYGATQHQRTNQRFNPY